MAKKPVSKIAKGSNGRRVHGPKTHIHHSIQPKALRHNISQSGLLSKYYDYESWQRACVSRGKKSTSYEEFASFVVLDQKAKVEYFKNIRKR